MVGKVKKRVVSELAVGRLIERKARRRGGCCQSCHEDVAYGFDLLEADLGKGRVAFVCCEVLSGLKDIGWKDPDE